MSEEKQGRIVRSISGFYDVALPEGILTCQGRGILRKEGQSPLTGDLVTVTETRGKGMIQKVLPRKNSFIRPAVANVDALVIFAANVNPITEPFLIDRVTAIAAAQQVDTLVLLTKCDLDPADRLFEIYSQAGIPVVRTSAETGLGVEEVRRRLRGKLAAFTGNSGVGKSTMLNCLFPEANMETGEVSDKLGRGRHTTRHVELFTLPAETFVMDTPGFSSFDTDQMDIILKENLQYAFPDFAPYLGRCQFHDCSHRKEPGCALRQAAEAGDIEPSRYDSYLKLYEKAAQYKEWEHK